MGIRGPYVGIGVPSLGKLAPFVTIGGPSVGKRAIYGHRVRFGYMRPLSRQMRPSVGRRDSLWERKPSVGKGGPLQVMDALCSGRRRSVGKGGPSVDTVGLF